MSQPNSKFITLDILGRGKFILFHPITIQSCENIFANLQRYFGFGTTWVQFAEDGNAFVQVNH